MRFPPGSEDSPIASCQYADILLRFDCAGLCMLDTHGKEMSWTFHSTSEQKSKCGLSLDRKKKFLKEAELTTIISITNNSN